MAMPITTRRRMYFLLSRYTERDNAASKGRTNLPPIEVEDQMSELTKSLESTSEKPNQPNVPQLPYDKLPPAVREALSKLEDNKSEVIDKPKMSQKKLTITSPKINKSLLESNKSEITSKQTNKKVKGPEVKLGQIVPNNEPKTLKEASEQLKQKKVSIPKDLLEIIKQKAQNR